MTKGFLCLEITSSRVRYIYVLKQNKGFEVLKASSFAHKLSVAAVGALSQAIQDILTQDQFTPTKIYLTVSRSDTLVRTVTLPSMTSQELEGVIVAQIEKIPNFFNNKFDFIFSKVPLEQNKLKVVYAAINQKLLNYILGEVQRPATQFHHLELSPLNLPNFFAQTLRKNDQQVILVVNDHVTYFIIYKDAQYELFYQTSIGTEDLYRLHDDQVDDKILGNLNGELQRVIKAYQSEHKNAVVDNVWLVWDSQGAGSFAERLQMTAGLKVSVLGLAQMSSVQGKEKQVMDNPIYLIATLPFLYEHHKLKPAFPYDHFFREFHRKRFIAKAALATGAYLVFIAAAVTLGILDVNNKIAEYKVKREDVEQETQLLRASSEEIFKKREEYIAMRQGLLDQATFVRQLNRVLWSQVFSVIANDMPQNIALTSFSFSESGQATFRGDSLDVETIAELIRRIDVSPLLDKGQFDYLREKEVKEQKFFNFGIYSQLTVQKPDTPSDQGEK